ncbi:unnamed protein product [Closterium sp. Yama58-4]|nr:unnamed protein product [Closterium sp. Yama58-4]
MLLAGPPPGSIMKCAFKGISFYIGQMEVENQMALQAAEQSKQMLKQMQEKYGVHFCSLKQNQVLQKEKENMAKDVSELQQKYAEKARQKRKLEEMYESLRGEYESLKQGTPGSGRPSTARVRAQAAYVPTPDSMELGRKRQNQGPFHIPGLPAPTHGRGVESPASGGRPFSRPEPSFDGNDAQGFFSTPSNQGNKDNALRNLLLSPALQRPPSRMGARFGQR